MGGHDCGRLAAETAANTFADAFSKTEGESIAVRLREALDAANQAVGDLFRRDGMYGGTTLLAAYACDGLLWWVSVGDSPLFIWRKDAMCSSGRLLRLNADHSMRPIFAEMAKSGVMEFSEALAQGHSLRSAVTGDRIPLVDAPMPRPLLPGDRILLASDGADELLLPAPMSAELRSMFNDCNCNLSVSVVEACQRMELPMADNVTVLSLDF